VAATRVSGGVGIEQRDMRRWKRERERGKISLRLFFLDLNDYIASLFIVLSRLVS
jgi:hypothetical protein